MDILGFTRFVRDMPLGDLAAKYERFVRYEKLLNRGQIVDAQVSLFAEHELKRPACLSFVFSDSIILIGNSNDPMSCLRLMIHAWRLVQAALSEQMPMRGAIACGDMYINRQESIFLGPALTRAYELEQAQDWIGVALDASVEDAYPELFPPGLDKRTIYESLFLKYDVPLKEGTPERLRTLNWRWNFVVEKGTRSLFPSSDNPRDQVKIDNTLKYAESVVRSGLTYADDPARCPAELQTFFVGGKEPPFAHGDDL